MNSKCLKHSMSKAKKKRSQLSSDKIIRNRTKLEKLEKSISMSAVKKVSSKKQLLKGVGSVKYPYYR